MHEARPTPEQMLERAAEERERSHLGRLKIFFGAAPGVGKTYAMLEAAQARKRLGTDVVIGWIETHGRRETEALCAGLERVPPRIVGYRDVELREFDLDRTLERRPALVLLDELAHSNAPGSRHAKRWQDLSELLDAGIDVYTTLNVQHVESLNDLVSSLTGVRVHETVPDSVIDRAEEIELVDLPPDELLQRLAEGKVYVPAQAERAVQNFFQKGNLIALRELALRRTAARVQAQASEWKREHGPGDAARTGERILIAISHAPQSANLVRAGRRMADYLRAPWIVVSVETPAFERLPAPERERLSEHVALAQRLGAETLVLRGERASAAILAAASERNVSLILVGKPTHARWRDRLRGSLVDELVRGSGSIDVLVTRGLDEGQRSIKLERPARRPEWREYLWALVPIAASTLVCLATRSLLSLADQAMIHLLGVLIAASRCSRLPSLVAAVASVAALDFFFVPPFNTFAIADLRYGVTFLVMLIVAIAVSRLTSLLREVRDAAEERERRTAAVFAMSREFTIEDETEEIARIAARNAGQLLDVPALVLIQRGGELSAVAGDTAGPLASEREQAVARWVYEHGQPAGRGTQTLPGSVGLYLPLIGSGGPLGVLGVEIGRSPQGALPSQRQVLETFVAQTAVALERVLLREEASRSRLAIEAERMRSALLSTVSHDLRTPLASITGAASALLDEELRLDRPGRRELLLTIREESERLGRLVTNLLDLTRLESGKGELRLEWCPLEEVIHSALGRLAVRWKEGQIDQIRVASPDEVVMAAVDPVLLEQVLVNLLENAVKYGPPAGPIDVRVRREKDEAVVEVADRGPGIPPGEEEKIFETFYRIPDGGPREGAGLGLAVCRAIVNAHGGRIEVTPRAGGGAVFRVVLPVRSPPPTGDGAEPRAEPAP